MSVLLGITNDQHNDASGLNQYLFGDALPETFDVQYRQTSTAIDIYDNALADFVLAGVDFAIQLGDFYNDTETLSDWDTAHANMLARRAETGPDTLNYSDVLGNHEVQAKNNYTLAEYWLAVDGSTNPISRENVYQGTGSDDLAYTFDMNGIRFVVLFGTGTPATDTIGLTSSQQTWLTDTALSTSLPAVVFTHGTLIENTAWGYANEANEATIRGLLEASGNVQVVFAGHFHRNGIAGYGSEFHTLLNGIHYFNLRGACLGASNGDSNDTATIADGAYATAEIIPHAVNGVAQVNVTGYLKGGTKLYETFIGV